MVPVQIPSLFFASVTVPGSPTKTSRGYNALGRAGRVLGPLLGLGSLGLSARRVATAPPGRRVAAAIKEGGAQGGGMLGAWEGGEFGAALGPAGAVIGALAGGFVGGVIGGGVAAPPELDGRSER